jgi:hypothetical protein
LVLRAVVELDTLSTSQSLAADVSGDGNVTAFDGSLILRYVVGLITGFPGLGKSGGEGALAASYEFQLRNGGSADEIELVVRSKGTARIFAADMHLTFDPAELTILDVRKGVLSDAMTMQSNLRAQSVLIALAGTEAMENEGDLVRFVFKPNKPVTDLATSSIRFAQFRLNESALPTGLESTAQIPTVFGLEQNYPNPFNPETIIRFQLPVAASVSIAIYDLLGREVRTLVDEHREAGFYTSVWDGRSNAGHQVATGVYFYRILARGGGSEFTTVKRMMLVR